MQGRAGNTLEQTDIGNEFQNKAQMAHQLKEKIDK
jgi:hypothetical protein